jgi:hypothetical protein
MKTIVLISCGKKKRSYRTQAQSLYLGALFIKSLAFAKKMNPDAIYILSAKHRLLELEQEIEPYDLTLKTMSSIEVKNWADQVLLQLRLRADLADDRFVFLAGKPYRRYLVPHLTKVEIPMLGLGIGLQLQFLSRT